MKELLQPLKVVPNKFLIVDGDGWCYKFLDCFAFVWFVVLQVMCDNLWQCLTLLFLFVVLDCCNARECYVGFDICNLWEVQTICGSLVYEDDMKLSLQFMKEL